MQADIIADVFCRLVFVFGDGKYDRNALDVWLEVERVRVSLLLFMIYLLGYFGWLIFVGLIGDG